MDSKEAKKLIVEAYKLDKELKEGSKKLAEIKRTLQEYFDSEKTSQLTVESSTKILYCKKIEAISINFIPEKLKEKLSKELFDLVVDKKYIITDYKKLTEMLKMCGASAKEFKKCVSVEYTALPEAIKQLYRIGEIDKTDLGGTFESKVSKRIQLAISGKKNE